MPTDISPGTRLRTWERATEWPLTGAAAVILGVYAWEVLTNAQGGAKDTAELVINAADLSVGSQDALTRINDGFQELVARTYTQLGLLGGHPYSEQQIAGFANPDQSVLFDDSSTHALAAPADEGPEAGGGCHIYTLCGVGALV